MKKIVTIAAIAATLVSCSGGGGRPTFGDNEYPVVTAGTSQADMQTTYPASIKGVQDVGKDRPLVPVRYFLLLITRPIRLRCVRLRPLSMLLSSSVIQPS